MKDYSRYLINEDPIFFLPTLAKAIGLNEAILLQKIHGWLNCTKKEKGGRNWIYNTYKSWQEQLPFFSESTVKRTMKSLIDKGIVVTNNFNKTKFDKTLWYSIDYEKLEVLIDTIDSVKLTFGECQNEPKDEVILTQPIPIYNNNNKNNNNNIVEQVIDYMNELAGTSFKSTTKKTRALINARLQEGFTLDDLKDVVYAKYNEWFKKPIVWNNGVSSDKYYRPDTLFSTKFESYLENYRREYK